MRIGFNKEDDVAQSIVEFSQAFRQDVMYKAIFTTATINQVSISSLLPSPGQCMCDCPTNSSLFVVAKVG